MRRVSLTLLLLLRTLQQPELSEDELAAREAEASMQGHTHNLLNQSVAAGYRTGAKQGTGGSEHADGEKVCWPWCVPPATEIQGPLDADIFTQMILTSTARVTSAS